MGAVLAFELQSECERGRENINGRRNTDFIRVSLLYLLDYFRDHIY